MKDSFSGLSDTGQTAPKSSLEIDYMELLKTEFNCAFDKKTKLVKYASEERLILSSQSEYDQIGNLVIGYVQSKMKKELGMKEIWIPEDSGEKCNIFLSNDWETNTEKAMVLIQGARDVRAGIWARSVCINENLELGSMLPYINQALQEKYSAIIFNPNFNKDPKTGKAIKYCENSFAHTLYVWEKYVQRSRAKSLAIVAHSFGGVCTLELIKKHWSDFNNKVKAIAFTDSVHTFDPRLTQEQNDYLMRTSVNWAKSSEPLNTKIVSPIDNGCVNVSAGHAKHEFTSGTAKPAVFNFFREMLNNNKNNLFNL